MVIILGILGILVLIMVKLVVNTSCSETSRPIGTNCRGFVILINGYYTVDTWYTSGYNGYAGCYC